LAALWDTGGQIASYELLIVDELGFVPLSKTGAELLFEMLSQRYERGSTMLTSNLPFAVLPTPAPPNRPVLPPFLPSLKRRRPTVWAAS